MGNRNPGRQSGPIKFTSLAKSDTTGLASAAELWVAAVGTEVEGPFMFITEREANEWVQETAPRMIQELEESVNANITKVVVAGVGPVKLKPKGPSFEAAIGALREAGFNNLTIAGLVGLCATGAGHGVKAMVDALNAIARALF